MKKRLITMLLMLGMMTVGFMGCQSDKTTDETNENITIVKECSLCEIEKECGVYFVEEQEYIVCDDCYNEFAHGMGLADVQDNDTDWVRYMASIEEQSDNIKDFLENDAMTQLDMNEKTQELYELWDGALNDMWSELKDTLSEEEFEKLRNEQRTWISNKEKLVEEVGKEYEGGSMYSMVVNGEAAEITEKRVYELYVLLK